ncbi:D-alanyl-D-alanine carboxypeptidase [Sinimarinibacterium sp. CAU 1509]|uniref:D-alanyl-D-alanine carboxypeptidase family protein n=1 Tax=Sinimarinibacterium sp. CAU 1509 TaxID=2562283 RepID=UPI0010AB753A|nr:D-alanyl-D-alanine carboxypeptidase family protein [Sinimarinibacterium sp. CAU 1509]TJY65193.1 D-alanyl-D-alanine carboxypeptidase [Sinimarinibacterium sp. CAU 1509]
MKFFTTILPLLLLSLTATAAVPEPPQLEAKSYVLLDFQSGQVLAQSNAHQRVEPASITKIMTAYVAFDELRQGHVSMDDQVLISEKAWRTPGSRTFVEVGKRVAFSDLLHGSIIQSGNDATVAIAEHIAGDESVFAQLMNEHASKLGMKDTHYVNADGLPDPDHYTSAYDVALLSQALIRDFPEGYKLFSQRTFTFGHRSEITQHNRNLLLDMDSSADGIKTGHTDSAGYCLAGSAIRDGRRLITAVMGTGSTQQRAQASKALLDYGFRFFDTVALFGPDKPVNTVRIWKGESESLPVGVAEPLMLSLPRGSADQLTVTPVIDGIIVAPVAAGQTVGKVSVSLDGETLRTVPLVALQPIAEGGLMQRLIDSVRLWIDS